MSDAWSVNSDRWLADFAGRSVEFVEEVVETNTLIAQKWGDRSLDANDDWTVDTVTADLIEAWEYWTPLMGRFIDLGLEAMQSTIRPGGRDV